MTINLSGKTGGGGSHYTPVLVAANDSITQASPYTYSGLSQLPGFVGNGDIIAMPSIANGAWSYYNSSGTQVFSFGPANANASADYWAGLYYDGDEDAVYMVAYDSATTPDTFYLCKRTAGVTTAIGSGVQITFTSSPYWSYAPNLPGGSLIQPTPDNTSTIDIRVAENGKMTQYTLDKTTGAQVGGGVNLYNTNVTGNVPCFYETPNGNHVSIISSSDTNTATAVVGNGTVFRPMRVSQELTGLYVYATNQYVKPIVWGDYVVVTTCSNTGGITPPLYYKTDFDNWVDSLAENIGIA